MFLRWLRSALRRPKPGRSSRKPSRTAPRVETLEERDVPTTLLPPGFTDTTVATGLTKFTTALQFAPDGRLFVSQQNGQVRIVKNGQLLPTPRVVDLSDTEGRSIVRGLPVNERRERVGKRYPEWAA